MARVPTNDKAALLLVGLLRHVDLHEDDVGAAGLLEQLAKFGA